MNKEKQKAINKITDAYILGYEASRARPENSPRIYAEDKIIEIAKEVKDEILDSFIKKLFNNKKEAHKILEKAIEDEELTKKRREEFINSVKKSANNK